MHYRSSRSKMKWPRPKRTRPPPSIWVHIPITRDKQEPDETRLTTTIGQLKAKLAKLKRELLTPSSSGGGGGAGFDVARTGVASVYVHRVKLL